MLVLRHCNRQLFNQRHRQNLGHRNAIMDGMGRSRRIMFIISSLHFLYHEKAGNCDKRMLRLIHNA